jgi:hypothetical protein
MQEKLVEFVAKNMPPLKRERNPMAAAVLGFLFGGIGLAIYLRSWVDAGLAVASIIALDLAVSMGLGIEVLAVLLALGQYGYVRAEASNRLLRGEKPTSAPGDPAVRPA